MKLFRKYAIVTINLFILIWLFKVLFFDNNTDVAGLFALGNLFFLVLNTGYAFALNRFFLKNENNYWLIEFGFVFLLLLPLFLLWYLTS